ncbi:MAG TPA: zf-HC2 domain-containing protein [Planctomycetota bacterium]|nr:zf-HC2 domain-containing protein [Planctomycetota bacterium]
MAAPENKMSCDELFDLTADGLDGLDDGTRARVEEHAKTCEECRLHLEGVRAADEAEENPESVEPTSPEVRAKILERVRAEAAREAKGQRGPGIFPLLLAALLLGATIYFVPRAPEHPAAPPPAGAPAPPGVESPKFKGEKIDVGDKGLKWPAQWLGEGERLIREGQFEEARMWLKKVLAHPTAREDIKAEAQEKLEEIRGK